MSSVMTIYHGSNKAEGRGKKKREGGDFREGE